MIHKFLYTCFLVCSTALCSPILAQLNSNNLTSYPESGGTFVYDVLSDKMGNIWLATQNGLMRYDGYEFKLFHQDPNDAKTIGSILTYVLHEDRNGNIWIGCMSIISVYNPRSNTFKNFNIDSLTDIPIYAQPRVNTIASDTSGKVYFGVDSEYYHETSFALLYYNEQEDVVRQIKNRQNLEVNNAQSVASDNLGNVWFRCENGLFKIDATGELHKIDIPEITDEYSSYSYSPIGLDNEGLIWMVSDYSELYSYDPETGNSQSYSMEDVRADQDRNFIPIDFVFDSIGNMWMGTSHGLIFYDRANNLFKYLRDEKEQNGTIGVVIALEFDVFGDLWIGTRLQGVLKYSPRTLFKSFLSGNTEDVRLTAGWASKLCESEDGTVWIGTSNGYGDPGLNALDPNSDSINVYPVSTLHPDLRWLNAIIEDNAGEILVHGGNGFYTLNSKTNTMIKTSLDGVSDTVDVQSMYKDSRDGLWLCADLDGLFFREKDATVFSHIELTTDVGGEIFIGITKVFESIEHGLWVMTDNGLYLYDYETKSIARHGYDRESGDILISQDINALCVDKEGIVWVGTWGGGLSHYDVETGSIRTYTMEDGLPSMNIQGILEDEKSGVLWLSTFEGLSRFNIETEQFNNFAHGDGIQGRLFAEGGYLKTSSGYFVFGGSNGINIFRPEDIARNSLPPKVYVKEIEIAGTSSSEVASVISLDPMVKQEEILLEHNQNSLSIDYVGIHYANPAKNQFAYMLENYDEGWRNVANQRSAFYYNLPPGKYTFRVKAANSNGVWSDGRAMVDINIAPPWWRTWWAYLIYTICLMLGIFAIERLLRRRVVEKQKALTKDKELAHAREIEKAYVKLKTTQTQLIHSEKMASLGELTAGIAHEIQNPLNFVNNFAEVSVDMLDEMDEEMTKGNIEEVNAIKEDLKQNLDKINFHGQRASGIVKGMLEHSRSGDGHKEPTDLNVLADEYLRLAYHGLRAKDKSFNADFKTDLDEALPKINIVPQDISRVLLNLVNNAFHAVKEKAKESDDDYQPSVIVRTRSAERVDSSEFVPTGADGEAVGGSNYVQIRVKDNGSGIPQNVLDKIFQPFFTTKRTGEGTGLGLSLSYDIIKAHGGQLRVETIEGEGTEFIIELPHNSET